MCTRLLPRSNKWRICANELFDLADRTTFASNNVHKGGAALFRNNRTTSNSFSPTTTIEGPSIC